MIHKNVRLQSSLVISNLTGSLNIHTASTSKSFFPRWKHLSRQENCLPMQLITKVVQLECLVYFECVVPGASTHWKLDYSDAILSRLCCTAHLVIPARLRDLLDNYMNADSALVIDGK